MPNLRKSFAKAVGSVAIVAAAVTGCGPIAADSSPAPAPATDLYFNMMTPDYPADAYQASINADLASLQSSPDMIKITADNSQAAIDQIVAGVRAEITKNGGQLNRIIFSGDGSTNSVADPLPNDTCNSIMFLPGGIETFCSTEITDILKALVVLQGQDFPGHSAGDPLGRAIDISACDILATQMGGSERLPSKEFSALAAQLNMPIIASVTEVGYAPNPGIDTGVFYAVLPDGNVSFLPGPAANTGEDVDRNKAWIEADGFIEQKVSEPVADHPFSVVNNNQIAAKRAHPSWPQRLFSFG